MDPTYQGTGFDSKKHLKIHGAEKKRFKNRSFSGIKAVTEG